MKVLIVDDSIVFRTAIKAALQQNSEITEIDVAENGKIAVEKIKNKHYDGVTLDLEMPVLDGIATVEQIRSFNLEIPIIIYSSQNLASAKKTISALQKGADDFVQKEEGTGDLSKQLKMIQQELVPRLKALLTRDRTKIFKVEQRVEGQLDDFKNTKTDIVCIASSTGGPDVLMKVFKGLKKLSVPVLIVQHMPPVFTTQFAKSLDQVGENKVLEAQHGDLLEAGVCYLAPGNYHMKLEKDKDIGKYRVFLDQGEKVCFVRPAADETFQSVADNFVGKISAFIFTGMGQDGAVGSQKIKEKGGVVAIQDKETSIVWGMPGAVHRLSAYDVVLGPCGIIEMINSIASTDKGSL